MSSSLQSRRVAVVGGGISGLAAAHRLTELDPAVEIALLEAADRLGGVLRTTRRDGYLIERSADSFITSLPWAIDLCRRIGFADQLLETNDARRKAFIVKDGRLHEVPRGFVLMAPKQLWSVVTTPLLSPRGKLRLAWEYFVRPAAGDADESVAAFGRRRLGREAFERLVEPLVGGIYTADAEKLSLAAALPQFREMERRHGGLIRAARAEAKRNRGGSRRTSGRVDEEAGSLATSATANSESGARYGMFVAPRDGMSALVAAIAAKLPPGAARLNAPVEGVAREGERWRLALRDGETLACDGLILATPAPQAARLLANVDEKLAAELAGIEHAGSAVVALGYRRDQITRPVEGFGFVAPAVEGRRILAGSFASEKFPGRAPEGRVLIRVFLGGALRPELAELPEEELFAIAREELGALIGARGEPELALATRWPATMPQYHVGHLDRVARIERRAARLPGLALAGNALRGVGVPQCVRAGETAAAAVVESLESGAAKI